MAIDKIITEKFHGKNCGYNVVSKKKLWLIMANLTMIFPILFIYNHNLAISFICGY